MGEVRIESIAEYVKNVCELNERIVKYTPIRSQELLFRGQADKKYDLKPAIGRNRKYDCDCTIFNEERNLIEMAKYKLPDVFRGDMMPVEILALLQHHGVPTRLLDVTENALVALYFACVSNENEKNEDGEVIVFKHDNDNVTNYPIVNAIADSYRFTDSTWTALSSFYENVKKQPYFLEQIRSLRIVHKTNKEGGNWIKTCCEKILYIHAPIRSIRQQVQQGRYILFHNTIDYEIYKDGSFCAKIDEIPKGHPDIVARIIIPTNVKRDLLADLSLLGIKEDVLFCDNIDKVCGGVVEMFARKYR